MSTAISSSTGIIPFSSSGSIPSRPNAPEPDSMSSEGFNLAFPQSQSKLEVIAERSMEGGTPMGLDKTFATMASDGFGSMRSDHSVEEILLPRVDHEHSPGKRHVQKVDSNGSIVLDALALEPVATSSPPRKRSQVHTPRAQSISSLPVVTPNNREKSLLALPVLESVTEASPPSPSKSSPSRSPMSKLRKERPPMPQFDTNHGGDESSGDQGSARRILSGRNAAAARISPAPSPTPGSRSQARTMLTSLGHGRRPSSRASGTTEVSSIDRMRRAVTVASGSPRGTSFDEFIGSRVNETPSGRNAFEQSDRYSNRTSIERPSYERASFETSLGPRTAKVFAAAGVLEQPNRSSVLRSASAMGFRRDGVEREFGNTSGIRSLASSPIPMFGMSGPAGAAGRRLSALQERDHQSEGGGRGRSGSESWSRMSYNRTPETVLRTLNGHRLHTDPSVNSSPTSTIPSRTAVSSSASSHLPNPELRKGSSPIEPAASVHQAAIQLLKERHELEKEALLSALSEAKKELRSEKEEKEEMKSEITEMGIYVEELETKLGEALARIRWMEKEVNVLRATVSTARVSLHNSIKLT